jgi:hypothetical protein
LFPSASLWYLKSCILSLCSSMIFRGQVSHPYKTTGNTTVLYILICMFLDSRRHWKSF